MTQPVLLFDGVCNLCNGLVLFFLNHERNNKLRFSPLQSAFSQNVLKKTMLPAGDYNTIVFIENDKIFIESAAVFEVAKYLKSPFNLIRIFSVLPLGFTDFIYRLVAKNRTRLFGKRNGCMVPDDKWRNRFLD